MRRLLFWSPRLLAIAFAFFLGIFALDVFTEGYSFWETLAALFMHLIPTLFIVSVLAVAWRWERVGGSLFVLLGLAFFMFFMPLDPIVFLLIVAPAVLTGALFLMHSSLPDASPLMKLSEKV